MNNFMTRTDNTKDDWKTPQRILDALGEFDLDPCANIDHPSRCAKIGLTEFGLEMNWNGRVWLNPPYGSECKLWMKKMAEHGNGIALIPPRMGSNWFQKIVLDKFDAILFLKGRISFIDADTDKPVSGNNADSILIAYGKENVDCLKQCGIAGVIWEK